jgi:hypothetical protein
VSAALKLPERHFVIDGQVVVLRQDGTSDFDALASRKHDKRAMLYAFDLLAGDGDLRMLPLHMRKVALAQLLEDSVDGIFIAEYERGDIGDVLFKVACNMGVGRHCFEAFGSALWRRPVQALDQSEEPKASSIQQDEGFPSVAAIPQIRVVHPSRP